VDDSTIQPENTSNSADCDPSDSDEASNNLTSDDLRSLSDGLERVLMREEPVAVEEPVAEIFASPVFKRDRRMKSWGMA
jgi:hypothetical protein